jgi:hypothetical protein
MTAGRRSAQLRFTLAVGDQGTGIGDQLYQTQLLYNLGRSCGWQYVHDSRPRAWINRDRRSGRGPTFDHHAFLGLDRGELQLSDLGYQRFLDLDSREVLDALVESDGAPPDLSDFPRRSYEAIRLCFNRWFYTEYDKRPKRLALPVRHQLDLREKYVAARADDPVALPFGKTRVPIVVFLRLMELVWYERDGQPEQPALPPGPIDYMSFVTPPGRAASLVRALADELGADRCELWVYSDGLPNQRWLSERIRASGRYDPADVVRVARQVLAFQHRQLALLADCGLRTRYRIKGSTALIREVVEAFRVAPFALARRASGRARHHWNSAFPDLGLRDPALPRVLRVADETPDSVRRVARQWARRSRRGGRA